MKKKEEPTPTALLAPADFLHMYHTASRASEAVGKAPEGAPATVPQIVGPMLEPPPQRSRFRKICKCTIL